VVNGGGGLQDPNAPASPPSGHSAGQAPYSTFSPLQGSSSSISGQANQQPPPQPDPSNSSQGDKSGTSGQAGQQTPSQSYPNYSSETNEDTANPSPSPSFHGNGPNSPSVNNDGVAASPGSKSLPSNSNKRPSSHSGNNNGDPASPEQSTTHPPSNSGISLQAGKNKGNPLAHSELIAPLSQISSVQEFVKITLIQQTNITEFANQLIARLKGYLSEYALQSCGKQLGGALGSDGGKYAMQNYANESCENLTQIDGTIVTDVYLLEVMLNTTYRHYQQVTNIFSTRCV